MSTLQFPARTNGPPAQGILIKQKGMNASLTGRHPMPMKFRNAAGGSMFSTARHIYNKDGGGGKNFNDSSAYTSLRAANAIGQSSTKTGLPDSTPLAFSNNNDTTARNIARSRVRSGGCTAPKKKGAYGSNANTFKSGGTSRLSRAGNRQIFAP